MGAARYDPPDCGHAPAGRAGNAEDRPVHLWHTDADGPLISRRLRVLRPAEQEHRLPLLSSDAAPESHQGDVLIEVKKSLSPEQASALRGTSPNHTHTHKHTHTHTHTHTATLPFWCSVFFMETGDPTMRGSITHVFGSEHVQQATVPQQYPHGEQHNTHTRTHTHTHTQQQSRSGPRQVRAAKQS